VTRSQLRIADDPIDTSLTPSGRRELEKLAYRAGYQLEIQPSGFAVVLGLYDERVEFSGPTLAVGSFLRRRLFDPKPRGRRRAPSSGACAGCGVVVHMQQRVVDCRRPEDCALLTRH
jgi:hypothetical protein